MRSSDVTAFSLSTQPKFLTASLLWAQRDVQASLNMTAHAQKTDESI